MHTGVLFLDQCAVYPCSILYYYTWSNVEPNDSNLKLFLNWRLAVSFPFVCLDLFSPFLSYFFPCVGSLTRLWRFASQMASASQWKVWIPNLEVPGWLSIYGIPKPLKCNKIMILFTTLLVMLACVQTPYFLPHAEKEIGDVCTQGRLYLIHQFLQFHNWTVKQHLDLGPKFPTTIIVRLLWKCPCSDIQCRGFVALVCAYMITNNWFPTQIMTSA